jgi:hypothetical protein
MAVTLVGEKPGLRVGTLGALLLMHFDGQSTVEALDMLDDAEAKHAALFPRFSTLVVVSGLKLQSPAPGVRERSAALDAKYDAHVVGSAIVVLAKGVAAVIARSFIATWALITKRQAPTRTFRAVSEAVTWLASLEGQPAGLPFDSQVTAAITAFVEPHGQTKSAP